MSQREILLVYDKQCPVCDAYSRSIRIRDTIGELRLINARESSPVRAQIIDAGLALDHGMVLKMGDVLYYGPDAIHALALIASPVGVFNRLNHWIFRSATRSRLLYPALRACRNVLLRLLRRTNIDSRQSRGGSHL